MPDIVFEPATYYDVTVRCNTQSMPTPGDPDNPQPCPNYQRDWEVPEVYSNAGQPNIQCGPCGKKVEILAATKMDPQPEVS
ncbi:hypothetical protein [Streptomyces sp. NBC_00878]|uniref:hypothetical protein n=1 Tax=Streptomyces sp. NBC_00878 TaxID=2975854 RepID=UPI00224E8952|nr:hypothetical protein [Streptomyces sp. NBC_00878]MCX4911926.1 hypothetical protein [Streptomyces sp. NBC_00878]